MPPIAKAVILIVEDSSVAKLMEKTFVERPNYTSIVATLSQGIEILGKNEIPVDLLITNQPHELLEICDSLPVLYSSSNPDMELLSASKEKIIHLSKPFALPAFLHKVDLLLSRVQKKSSA